MINLLDQDTQAELRAAKLNVKLRQFIIMLLCIVLLIVLSYAVGYFILSSQADAYRQEAERYVPEKAKYADVIKQANEYNKNLATAKSIINNEFLFSDLLVVFAKTLPSNTILDGINVSTAELSKPVEITVATKSYSDAERVKLALQESPYFKDTKIRTITKLTQGSYPYAARIITTIDAAAITAAGKEGSL